MASHCWLAALSTYTFMLQYRAGKQNQDADALFSDTDLIRQFTQEHRFGPKCEVAPEVVTAICQSCLKRICFISYSSDGHIITLAEFLEYVSKGYA